MEQKKKTKLWYWCFVCYCILRLPRFVLFRWIRQKRQNDQRLVPSTVPKKIFIYWSQGWESAPELSKRCKTSWVKHNPDWKVIALDDQNLSNYISIDERLKTHINKTAFSDIVRVNILARYGGVWVDATNYCTKPLNNWLPPLMQSGFFAFSRKKTTISSWFIAAEQDSVLIKKMQHFVNQYWALNTDMKVLRFFWLHYLFEFLLLSDKDAKQVWQQTPRVDFGGPYLLQWSIRRKVAIAECITLITDEKYPLHKLSNKVDTPAAIIDAL